MIIFRRPRRHKLIAFEDASEKLLMFFPALRDAYDQEVAPLQLEPPPAYVVYESVFYPYVERLLASRQADEIERVFDFLEFLLAAEDSRLHDLVRIAILTPLVIIDPPLLPEARRYMGPATKAAFRQVQAD